VIAEYVDDDLFFGSHELSKVTQKDVTQDHQTPFVTKDVQRKCNGADSGFGLSRLFF